MLTAAVDRLPTKPDESRVALRGLDWVAYQQMRQLLVGNPIPVPTQSHNPSGAD
jgi:hypothetical protein